MKDGAIRERVRVGTIVLVTCGMVAGLWADDAPSPDSGPAKAATKVLHFPENQYMGSLSIGPDSGTLLPLGLDPEHVNLPTWQRQFIGIAQGDVAVPAGGDIGLTVSLRLRQQDRHKVPPYMLSTLAAQCRTDPDDLSGLSGLRPNDLSRLTVSSPAPMAHADERVLGSISHRHLTGLQMLRLNLTGVTSKGMEYLKGLPCLIALELHEEAMIGNSGLAVLKNLPSLEYPDCWTGASDEGLKHLGQLPNLRWLRIRTGRIYGPGLAELANLPRLERLCLWGETGLSDRHIQHLEGLTHLKSLTLWGNCSTLTDASLASITKLKNLEELHFIRTSPRFTPAGVAHLERLKHLKKVDFAEIWVSPASAHYGDRVVRRLTALPNLESIRGTGYLSAEGVKTLATFRNLKCLGLALKNDMQGYHGPTGLSHLAGLGSLEELYFTGGKYLSDTDLACLESLSRLRQLIILSENISGRGVASLSKLGQLESLSLHGSVTKSDLNQLSNLACLQTLDVRMGGNPDMKRKSDQGTLDLSRLTNLRKLRLFGLSFQDADLAFLTALHQLKDLSLAGESLPEEALRHLKDLHELKRLNIDGISCLTGDGLKHLSRLKELGDLTLRGRITNAALNRLPGLPSVRSFRVATDEPIRPQTVAGLKQNLPAVEFIHIDKLTRQPASRQHPGRTRVNQPRVNRRTQQNLPRRR